MINEQLELAPIDRRRETARALRRSGLTMAEIQRELAGIPRTRVLGWVRDILPARHSLRTRAKGEHAAAPASCVSRTRPIRRSPPNSASPSHQ